MNMRDLMRIVEGARPRVLNEIARPATRVKADRVLRGAGYRCLGTGAFAAVYRKPGAPYVLKVFAAEDRSYAAFVALAKQHQDNPHFPRFIGKIVAVTPQYHAIRMEPLTRFRYDATLIRRYLMLRDFVSDRVDSPVAMERADAVDDLYDRPELRAALDLIIDNLLGDHVVDLKQDNLMMRGSTTVITDPVVDPARIGTVGENLPAADPEEQAEAKPVDQERAARQVAEVDQLLRDLLGEDGPA